MTNTTAKTRNKSIQQLAVAAMFAAVVTLTTAYLFHIPIGSNGGYVHFGDAFIYLAATFLPWPYAMAAGAIGAGLADCLSGAMIWLIPTLIIKSVTVLAFTSKTDRVICKRNVLATVIGGVISIGGYYLAEVIITGGNFLAPLATISGGVIQSVGSAAIYLLVGFALDKAGLKAKLGGGLQ